MRTIKFRGKRKNWNPEYGQSEWMLGSLLNDKSIGEVGYGMDSYVYAEVIPETIGQFTGLTDKKGKEIFEGDIIGRTGFFSRIVMHDEVSFYTYSVHNLERKYPLTVQSFDECDEIIGNIHDNPELLNLTL